MTAFGWWSPCFMLGLLFCCQVFAARDTGTDSECSVAGAIRLDGEETNATCGIVEGRVQVCEEKQWRNLCDGNWTVQDATVTCRTLNFSSKRASNMLVEQTSSANSIYGVNCTGSESNFAECSMPMQNEDQLCEYALLVLCYLTDEKAELSPRCSRPDTEMTTGPSQPPTVTATGAGSTTSSTSSPTLTASEAETTSQPSPPGATDSSSILTAPTLYYFIGGLSAIIIAAILLVVVFLLTCCCCCKRRKDVSPTDAGRRENEAGELHNNVEYGVESLKAKDQATAHHQLQQSQPIYEAITSNENSSTHSQESPSSKPLMPAATELYSSIDQNNTYAQIEPHISSPCSATFSSPNAESYYQQLDHRTGSRTGSMKRELPSRPNEGIPNPTALAIARGEVQEVDLSTQAEVFVGGSSTSLPANTGHSGHHHQAPNGALQRPHLEEVQLKELMESNIVGNGMMESSEQTNVYNILDPPPDYSTLEQIDEISQVSTTAVCNNGVARGSRGSSGQEGSKSKEHSPQLNHYPQEMRSAILSSTGHSPRSSRTSSLSSNSPQVGRVGVGRKVSNKYSDDPTASLTNSPRINPSNRNSGQSNRHSGQSNGSENLGDRDTLV